jgi:thiamine pyrophosphate-dependent acetolactate synthase large subunit-like protein
MSKTVAQVLVGVLEQIGVRHIFGLIGDSLNPLADAIRRSHIEWVGVRHEEGAALAAAGQAKLTGDLSVCAGTTGRGSTHLVAGLYEAARDHAPVLALSGNMEGMGLPSFREGIEFPNPDFAAFARACGGHGFTAGKPGELRSAISQALAIDGPAIVDAVVVSNELPNLPHLDLEMVGRFTVAKVKEAVLAVTGE